MIGIGQRFFLAVGFGALMVVSSAAVAQDDELSTAEREALSAKAADRQARRDIESLLKPSGKFERGMFIVLRGTTLETLPYATSYPGLCQRDELGIDYAPDPANGRPVDANTPLRPYRLRLSTSFNLDRRRFRPMRMEQTQRDRDAGCIANEQGETFFAPDEDAAVAGYTALQSLAARLRAGSLTLSACDAEKGTSCTQVVLGVVSPGHLGQIQACPAVPGTRCLRIDADNSVGITIMVATPEGAVTPESISSAKVETYIIIT